ncbi:uncharacterized protein BBOV_IV011180 [Babesia bovis T2Bo]|uniref:Protein FAM76A n=1 Tax=Babesia bovis TaxID=5865 RepID=A7ASF1_BABBO|nr:uncharacterized protein BBOV_IV011180 [Babesia bovis T2Bo]EDO07470.1 hypothetical protein BBOV_IV011180 [Babesia bovis T2Bo]BAN64359.1 conserved hypothetical protein [Babesia bovis]|eukprot:XP_001611038.1 hypothetical protein [Babesia bovis T2Bo]
MNNREDLRNGVKLNKSNPSKQSSERPQNRSIWDKIAKLEQRELCLECEHRRWKTNVIQVCETCAKGLPSLKCCHCKISYVNHKYCFKASNIYNREMCMSCASNWATYNNEPKLCRFCNQWSAWRSTSECDRCRDLLEKYGQPSNCESCNNNAAFDRGESARKRVNDLKLCFLCTCNYKQNDYYNRKLMKKMNIDTSERSTEDVNTDQPSSARDMEDSPLFPEKVQSANNGNTARTLEQELKELKDAYNTLKKKYAKLKDENISLRKRVKMK